MTAKEELLSYIYALTPEQADKLVNQIEKIQQALEEDNA